MNDWQEQIKELETFFETTVIPERKYFIGGGCQQIINPQQFIKGHLPIVKGNMNNKTFLPYLLRLIEFKDLLENLKK